MDEVDVEILKILWQDGRTPVYKIAKMLGLSNAAIDKRIKNMIRRGELLGFTVLLNPDRVLNSAVIAVRTKKKRKDVMDAFFMARGVMHVIACLGGRYYGEIWYLDDDELEEKVELIRHATHAYRIEIYRHRKLSRGDIDDIDWKIILGMKHNSRISFSELSKIIKISSKTISRRWKRLVEENLCKSYPVINRPLSQDIFWFSLFVEVEDLSVENDLKKLYNLWRTSLFSEPQMVYGVFYAKNVRKIDETIENVISIPHVKKVHYEIIVEERFNTNYLDYVRRKIQAKSSL